MLYLLFYVTKINKNFIKKTNSMVFAIWRLHQFNFNWREIGQFPCLFHSGGVVDIYLNRVDYFHSSWLKPTSDYVCLL